MTNTDITGTYDTTGAVGTIGNLAKYVAPVITEKDTSGTTASGVSAYAADPSVIQPPVAGTFDTTKGSVGGVSSDVHQPNYTPIPNSKYDTETFAVFPNEATTLDTTQANFAGHNAVANPAYRAPANQIAPVITETDTTRTNNWNPAANYVEVLPAGQTGTKETAYIGAVTPQTGVVDAAPTGVTAVGGPRSITVSWTPAALPANAEAVSSWVVRGDSDGTAYVPKNATSAVITNLVPNRDYRFKVYPVNKSGEGAPSSYSNYAQALNPDQPQRVAKAPANLTATPHSTSMDLAWTSVVYQGNSIVTDFVVEYKLHTAPSWTVFSHSPSTSGAITVTGLTTGQSYDFRVRALNGAGVGSASTVTATPA